MFDQVLCHDDRLLMRVEKVNKDEYRFPLSNAWKESRLLRVTGTYEFEKDGQVYTGRIYGLRNSFIQAKQIQFLKGVRIEIQRNCISIELNNILNVFPEVSRYKLLHNILFELWKYGVIKARCRNKRSLNARLYFLLGKFKPAAYEIRFDMNREQGKYIYQKCKLSRYYCEYYNTIALSSPYKKSKEKNGYYLKLYDRGKGFKGFPYRLELTLYRKRLPDKIKGNPKKIITEMEEQIYSCTVLNPLYRYFYEFFNHLWFQDEVKELSRERLEEIGRNWNQYKKSII